MYANIVAMDTVGNNGDASLSLLDMFGILRASMARSQKCWAGYGDCDGYDLCAFKMLYINSFILSI